MSEFVPHCITLKKLHLSLNEAVIDFGAESEIKNRLFTSNEQKNLPWASLFFCLMWDVPLYAGWVAGDGGAGAGYCLAVIVSLWSEACRRFGVHSHQRIAPSFWRGNEVNEISHPSKRCFPKTFLIFCPPSSVTLSPEGIPKPYFCKPACWRDDGSVYPAICFIQKTDVLNPIFLTILLLPLKTAFNLTYRRANWWY